MLDTTTNSFKLSENSTETAYFEEPLCKPGYHWIYVYTTKSARYFGQHKIGMTTQKDPKTRIKQQDGTSNPEPLELVDAILVPNHIHDTDVRKVMIKSLGCKKTRTDAEREWLFCDPEDARKAINLLLNGVPRPDSFGMREEQQECHDKAILSFENSDHFLINAKMRFGKTFTSLNIAKTMDAKNVLIITWKPSVGDSFREPIEDHIYFDGWKFHPNGSGINPDDTAKVNVYFCSFQDMLSLDKEKFNGLSDVNFDLLILDEFHYGTDTEISKNIISQINHQKKLYISGTPTQALESGLFSDDEIYSYTYIDEQKNKRKEELSGSGAEIYKWMPAMNIFTFTVGEEVKEKIIKNSPTQEFSMSGLFAANENGFVDRASVKLLTEKIFGLTGKRSESPIRQVAPDHIFINMPRSILSVNAMCNLLEETVGDSYNIINVAGNSVTKLEELKLKISERSKSIVVSCGRYNTGVTVPEWDMVIMLDDGKSTNEYLQTIFRVQSPNKSKNKTNCYVVDYNPDRAMEMIYNYNSFLTKKGESSSKNLEDYLECVSFMDFSENYIKSVSVEDIYRSISKNGEYMKKFSNDILFDLSKISKDFDKFLGNVSLGKISKNKFMLNENGVTNKENKRGKNNSTHSENTENPIKINNILEKVKTITIQMPNLLAHIGGKDCYNLIKNSKDNHELFLEICKINPEDFELMVDCGFIKSNILDKFIHTFNNDMELL